MGVAVFIECPVSGFDGANITTARCKLGGGPLTYPWPVRLAFAVAETLDAELHLMGYQ